MDMGCGKAEIDITTSRFCPDCKLETGRSNILSPRGDGIFVCHIHNKPFRYVGEKDVVVEKMKPSKGKNIIDDIKTR